MSKDATKTLRELVDEHNADQAKAEEAAPESESQDTQQPEETTEIAESEPDGESAESEEEPEGTQADSQNPWLREFLAKRGFDHQGVDDENLEAVLSDLITRPQPSPSTTQADAKDGTEQPRLPTKDESESQEDAPPAEQRRLAKLQVEQGLADLVSFDERGNAVPKPEFGDESIAAAKKINAYSTERRKRIEALADDPLELLAPDLEAIVSKQLAKKFEEVEQKQKAEKQEAARLAAEKAEESAIATLLHENRTKLYAVDGKGAILKSIKDPSQPIYTPFGRDVEAEYARLAERYPGVKQSQLIEDAIHNVSRIHGDQKSTPKQSAEEKKKQFVKEGNKHESVSTERAAPSVEDKIAVGGKMSLADMMMQDPDNEGNPWVAKHRNK